MFFTYLFGQVAALLEFLFSVQLPSFFNAINLFANWWG